MARNQMKNNLDILDSKFQQMKLRCKTFSMKQELLKFDNLQVDMDSQKVQLCAPVSVNSFLILSINKKNSNTWDTRLQKIWPLF